MFPLVTSRRPDLTPRRSAGGRFNTRWRQLLLTQMRHRNADRALSGDNTGRSSPVPSSYLGDPGPVVPALEPTLDVPGNPVDPGSLIGPPLRSGYIQGQSPPVLPGAPSAYPVVVPEPSRLKPVLYTSQGFTVSCLAGSPSVISVNDFIPRAPISGPGNRIGDQTRCLGFRLRGMFYPPAPPSLPSSLQINAVYLVYDSQPNGPGPVVNYMFDNDRTGVISSDSLLTFSGRTRFKVLCSIFVETTNAILATGPEPVNRSARAFSKSINCNLPVNYGRKPFPGPGAMSLGNIYVVLLGPHQPTLAEVCVDYLYRDV